MRTKICFVTLVLILALGVTAFAAELDANFDSTNMKLSVKGQFSGQPGEAVTMLMFLQGSSDAAAAELVYTDASGQVSLEMPIYSGITYGWYDLRMGIASSEEQLTGKVFILDENDSDIVQLISDINAVSSDGALINLMNQNNNLSKLGLESDSLTNPSLEAVYLVIASSQTPLTVSDFRLAFDYFYSVMKIKSGFSADSIMQNKASLFGTTYADYLSSAYKSEVDGLLKVLDLSEGIKTFSELELLAKIRSCDNVSSLREIVIANSTALGISSSAMAKFNSLSNETLKQNVFTELKKLQANMNSFKYIADNFEALIPTETSGQTGTTGSSRPSGNNGLTGNISAPASGITPPNQSSGKTFTDISAHWAKSDIEYLANKSIINGYHDGSFGPELSITRAELAKMIAAAFGFKADLSIADGFGDVSAADWCYEYVISLKQKGIATGDGNLYRPNDNITRQEMVTMLARALKYIGYELGMGTQSFADGELIAPWAKDAVSAMSANGFVNGYNGYFRPGDGITRAETAAVLSRVLKAKGGEE